MHSAFEIMVHSGRSPQDAIQIIRAADTATGNDSNMTLTLRHGLASQHSAAGWIEMVRAADTATANDSNMQMLLELGERSGQDPFRVSNAFRIADTATGNDSNAYYMTRDLLSHNAMPTGGFTDGVTDGTSYGDDL